MFLTRQIIDLLADVTDQTMGGKVHQKVREIIEHKRAFAMHAHAFARARCLSHVPKFKIDWLAVFNFTLTLLSRFKFDGPDSI